MDAIRRKTHESENDRFWRNVPSRDSRVGAIPKKKVHKTNHTIAPAYNKGGYQVISPENIKDIGR
jgi:hypothetical protein